MSRTELVEFAAAKTDVSKAEVGRVLDALLELAKQYNSNIRFNLLKPIQEKHYELVPTKNQVLENYKYLFKIYTIMPFIRVNMTKCRPHITIVFLPIYLTNAKSPITSARILHIAIIIAIPPNPPRRKYQ